MQMFGLRLKYETGDYYTLYEGDEGNWKAKVIPPGKEIIGLFGDFDESGECISSLGFILWEPNPFAVWCNERLRVYSLEDQVYFGSMATKTKLIENRAKKIY